MFEPKLQFSLTDLLLCAGDRGDVFALLADYLGLGALQLP